MLRKIYILIIFSFFIFHFGNAQTAAHKYPGLLWEITGNGLKKPSYLFGTMHVSNKMVFHLSDSFYNAIQSCDEVALELNPAYWQRDMMKMESAQQSIDNYLKDGSNDYINEKSFQVEDYADDLKSALTQDPEQINSLLYRTLQSQEDYEENTYLDLYIYQTGRKMGKKAGGVEDYYETEKILFEAYRDMAKEKNKNRQDNSDISTEGLSKKIEDAYKRGDLDMLDSLEKLSFNSPAYLQTFLYGRDSIQANSIDTILKHNSLFVGVGAAHLPGADGVIELLRKKGYTLRPVLMQDRDADKKDEIDKLKVPVTFHEMQTDDGFVQVQVPGKLYKRVDEKPVTSNESWQYADMDNGTYYMLTRVKTHAAMMGQSENDMQKKIDSLLYENIPGKIIKKTLITKDGYPGFDITNKTRRGDVQRYNIIITPFEVLVFKMSGNEDYVSGNEADTFFNSISIKKINQQWNNFETGTGGFAVKLPQQPNKTQAANSNDGLKRWEYESLDSATGNAYMIWKETVQNYSFLEEDTFDLSLMEESLKRSEIIDKQTSRSFTKQNGYDALNMQFSLKNGGTLFAKAVLRGPHYYLLAVRSNQKKYNPAAFFNSFSFVNFKYQQPTVFKDTLLHFEVQTPEQPVLDTVLMQLVAQAASEDFLYEVNNQYTYWPKDRYAFFQSDSTGEAVRVIVSEFPKYYYSRDSAKFWKYNIDEKQYDGMIVKSKQPVKISDSCSGYKLIIQDTNTVRQITTYLILKDNRLFRITALNDTVNKESEFLKSFMHSFKPEEKNFGPSVFQNKLNSFFSDFSSTDSLVKKRADEALDKVYFGCDGLPKIMSAISNLKYGDKDYFDLKTKFIHELGFIDDSECVSSSEKYLADLYNKTADTGYFQNEILQSLANIETKDAYATLKNLLLQDPPVFDDEEDYNTLFESLSDSLALAKTLFPDILQLASFEDYKEPVNSLLRTMVDSGYLSAKDYRQYYSSIYFDAKIELKKQELKDEKLLEKENNKDDNDNSSTDNYSNNNDADAGTNIDDYSVLLVPFYDEYPAIPKFFDKLLQSKDQSVQLNTAILLIRNKKTVPDSVLLSLAADNKYRALLYSRLDDIKRTDLYPYKYQTQEAMARSVLLNDKNLDKFGDLQLTGKEYVSVKNKKGYVYFFKYKTDANDADWKIGISGIQPANLQQVSSNNDLTKMTDKKFTTDKTELAQFKEQLQKLIFSQHESAGYFFEDDNEYNYLQRRYNDGN